MSRSNNPANLTFSETDPRVSGLAYGKRLVSLVLEWMWVCVCVFGGVYAGHVQRSVGPSNPTIGLALYVGPMSQAPDNIYVSKAIPGHYTLSILCPKHSLTTTAIQNLARMGPTLKGLRYCGTSDLGCQTSICGTAQRSI